MNNNYLALLQLLKAFVLQIPPDLTGVMFDIDELMCLAKIHDVSAIVSTQLLLLQHDEVASYKDTFLQIYGMTVIRTARITEVQKILSSLFSESGIDHLLFKGTVIAQYYPLPELRTMGDIDVLVRLGDLDKAISILKNNGASEVESSVDVSEYIFSGVSIELHTNMIHAEIQTEFGFRDYFATAWNHAAPTERPSVWQLDPTFHLIYVIAHLVKHFHDRGCGVRMFIDVAILLEKQKDIIDVKSLMLQMELMHLDKFFRRLLFLNKVWFGQNYDIPDTIISVESFALITEYVISGGVFGYSTTPEENVALRKLYHEYRGESVKVSNVKLLIQTIFPDYEQLASLPYVSWVRNIKWIVPFAWIYRWVYCLLTKSRTVLTRMSRLLFLNEKKIQQIKKQDHIIHEMGL